VVFVPCTDAIDNFPSSESAWRANFSKIWACNADPDSLYPRPTSPPTQMEPWAATAQTDRAEHSPGTTATSPSRHFVGRRQVVGGRSPRGRGASWYCPLPWGGQPSSKGVVDR